MYINLWYVAAFSSELTDQPIKVRMLSRDFVLFRGDDGAVVCLSNVCPHRGVSLAEGKCQGGTIACPQHGWQFGGDGHCALIPSQNKDFKMLPGAKVDSYPTEERCGLIWTFLGDKPETAPPIPDMPEVEAEGWRVLEVGEVWDANYHWAKFSNIDLVHVPITHGQAFPGESLTPKEEISRPDDYTISSHIRTPMAQPKGEWENVREEQKHIASTLIFYASGITFKGHLEIGGEGSGVFATFYEMATPIDSQTTHMRLLLTRNFMPEPEHDAEFLKRNMKNVREDRAIAEAQLPKNGPLPPGDRDLVIDPDDTILKGYWEILGRLRDQGSQIDMAALAESDQGHRYCTIPSPSRHSDPDAWVHNIVPLISPTSNRNGS